MILAIFDIDETICDSWDWATGRVSPGEFFTDANMVTLKPLEPVASICREMLEKPDEVQVIYLSGRPEYCRRATIQWLRDNDLLEGNPPVFLCPEDHYKSGGTTPNFKISAIRGFIGQEREIPDLIVVYDDDSRNMRMMQQYFQSTRMHYEMFQVIRLSDKDPTEGVAIQPWGKYHPHENARTIVQQPDLDINTEDGLGDFIPSGVGYNK